MNKQLPNFDPETDNGPVPSPCISICKIDPKLEVCIACYRNLNEIAGWSSINDDTKREVWRNIYIRKKYIDAL